MLRFFAKRLIGLVLTMGIVSFLIFLTFELSPGDVARGALGQFATQLQLQKYREQHGLDRPFFTRYASWLGVAPNHKGEVDGILQGNLGYSNLKRAQVNTFIWDRIANTGLLALIAFALIAPISIVLGVISGMREGSRLDRTVSVLSTVTTSVPEFAMGAFLVTIFVVWLGILPGTAPLDVGGAWSLPAQLVLPVATLADAVEAGARPPSTPVKHRAASTGVKVKLPNPQLYLNRELAQLEFNRRVLAQAEDATVPLLERLRFVCIVSNNLDEFFEIRVAGLKAQLELGTEATGPDGAAPAQVLREVSTILHQQVTRQYELLNNEILPQLDRAHD